MYGCEIVWSWPIGNGVSLYAPARHASGTNSWRGTLRMAASTRGLVMSRATICSLTILVRAAFQSVPAGGWATAPSQAATMMSTAMAVSLDVLKGPQAFE